MMNWRVLWALIATTIVLVASIVSGSPAIVTLTSLVGVSFVLGVAYNWKYTNILGIMTTLLFGFLSYGAGYYANAFINIFVLTPLQVAAHAVWLHPEYVDKWKRRFKDYERTVRGIQYLTIPVAIIGWFVSITWGGSLWFHDGLSAALVITATTLLMFRDHRQWRFWIPYNFLEVMMWFLAASLAPEVLAIAAMRMVFFINSLIGWHHWRTQNAT